MIMGETVVKALEKSADLIFVDLCPRRYLMGIVEQRNPIASVCACGHSTTC
jgi:hypothetical protein